MMIDIKRLDSRLSVHKFHLWPELVRTGNVRFSRPSKTPDLFEHIWLTIYGDCGTVVGSSSVVSITAGPEPSHGTYVEKYHDELCTEMRTFEEPGGRIVKDYFSTIRTPEEATNWEQQLAAYAPGHLRQLLGEVGKRLLDESRSAREAAAKYWSELQHVPYRSPCQYFEHQLRQLLREDQLREANRIADLAVGNVKFLCYYQVAAMILLMWVEKIEGKQSTVTNVPYSENLELNLRISLLADMCLRADVDQHFVVG